MWLIFVDEEVNHIKLAVFFLSLDHGLINLLVVVFTRVSN